MSSSPNGEKGVREPSQKRRRQLLDATIEIMISDGVSAVTHRAVAAKAGLPASSTSYYFESIDVLMGEAVSAAMDRELERIADLEDSLISEGAGGGRLIEMFAGAMDGDANRHTVAQFEIYLYASRKPELRQPVIDIIEASRNLASRALLSFGVDNPLAARGVLALIDGFSLHRIAHPGSDDVEALLLSLRAMAVGASTLALVDSVAPAPR